MSLLRIMSIILNCLAFSSHEVFFNSIRWLNVLTSVIAFFFPPETQYNGIISEVYTKSQTKSLGWSLSPNNRFCHL